MIQSFVHSSESNNLYLYIDRHRLSMPVHPEFEKAVEKSKDADVYYLKKVAYMEEHGFFAEPEPTGFRALEESVVRHNIANTKQIVFEATDSCNLNCTYCALGELYEGYDERTDKKINTRYAINLLKYIFDMKSKNENSLLYISFYGGEALLNMKFIRRIVEVANQLNAEKGFDIRYSMTTNATLLHKYIDFLVAHKFRLLISLDGNEANHSYRVFKKNNKNSFQRVIDNLDMIQREYPAYFADHISFNAVLHDRNSVKEIYEFIYTRYQKIPRIAELNTREIRSDNQELIERMFRSKRKSETEFQEEDSEFSGLTHDKLSLYRDLMNFLKYLSINYYIANVNALLHDMEIHLPTGTCIPFSKKIFLTNRNKLLPCEKVNYKYAMGKVNENIAIDIPEITRLYNSYFEHIKKFCQTCYAYRFCGVCLFQLNNLDNINTEEFACERYQNQKVFKNRLHQIFSFLEKYPNDVSRILENVILG